MINREKQGGEKGITDEKINLPEALPREDIARDLKEPINTLQRRRRDKEATKVISWEWDPFFF